MERILHSDLEKSRPRVLVVDDEPSLLRLVQHLLGQRDFEVIPVSNPSEAMTYLQAGGIDAVIVDAVMPIMNGYDFTKYLRRHPLFAALPILMLSRKRERADVEKALEAGVSDYLMKPVDPELLTEKLNLSLKRSGVDTTVYELSLAESTAGAIVPLDVSIIGISETGVSLKGAIDFPAESPLPLMSPLFERIGIQQPVCRVVSSERLESSGYKIKVKFVGASEDDLRKIRAYVHREAIKRKK